MVQVTQATGVFAISGDAIDFSADNETLTILANLMVASDAAYGVFSSFLNSVVNNSAYVYGQNDGVRITAPNATVNNHGAVVGGPLSSGLHFLYAYGGNATVNNYADGLVTGVNNGIALVVEFITGSNIPSNIVINNQGKSIGLQFNGIVIDDNNPLQCNVSIINHGIARGGFSGIKVSGTSYRANFGHIVIQNDGTVESKGIVALPDATLQGGDAIDINIPTADTATIVNGLHGVIYGVADAILGEGGMFHLINRGTIIGTVNDAAGLDDLIVNTGKISGQVLLGGGNDVFRGAGGTSGRIVAGGGNDRIILGNGAAHVVVGGGSDTITAGTGPDQFIFNAPRAGQVELIQGFKPGLDKIVLSEADFAGIGPIGHGLAAAEFHVGANAQKAAQLIIYNPVTGSLSYDPDGSGPQAKMHFATLSPHLHLTQADFLVVA